MTPTPETPGRSAPRPAAPVPHRQGADARVQHHFTVDVEEYFQVYALSPHVPRGSWDDIPSRLEAPMDRLLQLLADAGSTGTFFVLGWVGERFAALVRRLVDAGHEVASHSQAHRRILELTPPEFRESVRRSRAVLEDVTGQPVLGYRAPSFSITRGAEWALEILAEEGYRYDSSLFPIRRSNYGYAGGTRDPYVLELDAGTLHEFPPTTARLAGFTVPAAGGGWFRLLPYALVRAGLRQAERRGHPGTFYIHPWELDVEQPRLDVPWKTRVRHYGGLGRTEPRLERLLSEFQFQPIGTTLSDRPARPEPDRKNRPLTY